MLKMMFWIFVWIGRPFGGIRPRRITHWLAKAAYGNSTPQENEYRWYRDRAGMEFFLHPHFLIDYHLIAFGAYDGLITSYIENAIEPGMVCLDVGANMGAMSVHLAKKAGPTGVVHCFEPVPSIFQRLKKHIERNHLETTAHLHQIALSDKTGSSSMRIASASLSNQGMGSIVNTDHPHLDDIVTIKTLTLDEFTENEKLTRVDFVKVDIQEAEPLFLQGGAATLAKYKPDLLMEIASGDPAGGGTTGKALLLQVESLGYEIFEITEAGRIGAKLNTSEVPVNYCSDAVLCRSKARG